MDNDNKTYKQNECLLHRTCNLNIIYKIVCKYVSLKIDKRRSILTIYVSKHRIPKVYC